jgi:hypothetical protein
MAPSREEPLVLCDSNAGVVDAALSCAERLVGMEVVFLSSIDDDTFRFDRIRGADWQGLAVGDVSPRLDSFCHRMLDGAPHATADAATDPVYAGAPIRTRLGIASYVGVPVRRDGRVVGTLCGIDRRRVTVAADRIDVLARLADVVAAVLGLDDDVTIRRTGSGWVVGGAHDAEDLTSAMVLADLLGDDLAVGSRPARPTGELSETERLQVAMTQLEHALAARVTVEQAIGVLSERLGCAPRDAFETLRRVARRGGVRVHELSKSVVTSASGAVVTLPPELMRR